MSEAPRRELGLIHGVGIVVGAIIGVGIFITPSKVAAIGGSPVSALLLWSLGGLIALCGALSLAEVGARFPESGGQIVALEKLLGRWAAFLYGWSLLIAIQTGVLVLVMLFVANNLEALLAAEWSAGEKAAVATLLLVVLAGANLLGVRHGAWVQTLTSAAKLLTLAAIGLVAVLVAIGLFARAPAPPPAPLPASAPWIAGLAAVLFSYGGFHQLTWVGGEVANPQRTVPRAIVLGILIVITAYLAANASYFTLLPFHQVAASDALAADAVGAVFPRWGPAAVAVALTVSAYGLANATLLTTPRVYFALAQKGLFFRFLGRLDPARGVPSAAILLQTGLALALLWIVGPSIGELVNGIVFVDWTFHVLTCAGLILVRRRPGDFHHGYRAPLLPFVPMLFMLGTVVALGATFLDPAVRRSSLMGLGVLAAGILLYLLVRRASR
ncbi:MAG: amino acid permease [Planctomycetota bacterium]|nr:MAG: amino acid permease [Planctomycetota bacterium]